MTVVVYYVCDDRHRVICYFPTRPSSDLWLRSARRRCSRETQPRCSSTSPSRGPRVRIRSSASRRSRGSGSLPGPGRRAIRSEEHTSELQSRENLVCRLLHEKKKPEICSL